MKKNFVMYAIILAIGAVFVPIMGIWRGLYSAGDAATVVGILCDCFTVPGLLYLFLGLLLWCTNGGAFDMLGYGMKTFFGVFTKNRQKESYYDYKQRKSKADRPTVPFLLSGLFFLVVSVILLIIYYNM